MSNYDAVFYSPEHRSDALNLINRLPREEYRSRGRLTPFVFKFSVPIPKADKTSSGIVGNLVMTAYYGVAGLHDGNIKANLDLEEIKAGLVGGRWKPEFLDSDLYRRLKEEDILNVSSYVSKRAEILKAAESRLEEEISKSRRRYYEACCRLAGIPEEESKLDSDEQIADAVMAFALSGNPRAQHMPSLDDWLAATVIFPPEMIEPDEIPDDEVEQRAYELFSSICSRQDKEI